MTREYTVAALDAHKNPYSARFKAESITGDESGTLVLEDCDNRLVAAFARGHWLYVLRHDLTEALGARTADAKTLLEQEKHKLALEVRAAQVRYEMIEVVKQVLGSAEADRVRDYLRTNELQSLGVSGGKPVPGYAGDPP